MINKDELLRFTNHCKKQFGIQIEDHVIEDFIQFVNRKKYHKEVSVQNTPENCGFNTSVCAHINFNTVQCDNCSVT